MYVIIPYAILFIVFLSIIVRLPSANIDIENNAGYFLYEAVFNKKQLQYTGCMGVNIIFKLFRKLFPNDNRFRWIFKLGVLANTIVALILFYLIIYLLDSSSYKIYYAIIGTTVYIISSSLPNLIPWVVNSEKYYIIFTSLSYLFIMIGMNNGNSYYFLMGGVLLGLSASIKIVSFSDIFFVAVFLIWAYLKNQIAVINTVYFITGSCVTYGLLYYIYISKKYEKYYFLKKFTLLNSILSYKNSDTSIDRGIKKEKTIPQQLQYFNDIIPATFILWIVGIGAAVFILTTASRRAHYIELLIVLWLISSISTLIIQKVMTPGHWLPLFIPLTVLFSLGMEKGIINTYMLSAVVIINIMFLFNIKYHSWRPSIYRKFQRIFYNLSRHITNSTNEGDKIFAWGWHPQIYVLAQRECSAPPLFYCDKNYLDKLSKGWELNLIKGVLKNPPSYLMILNKNFPFYIFDLAGFEFLRDKDAGNMEFGQGAYKLQKSYYGYEKLANNEDIKIFEYFGKLINYYRKYNLFPFYRNEMEMINEYISLVFPELKINELKGDLFEDILLEYRNNQLKIEEIKTNDGSRIFNVNIDDKNYELYDTNRPLLGIREELNKLEINNDKLFVVMGAGSGQHIKFMLDDNPQIKLIVVEKEKAIYEESLKYFDWSPYKERLFFVVGLKAEIAKRVIFMHINHWKESVRFIAFPKIYNLHIEYFQEITQK